MQKNVCLIALLSIITCHLHAAENSSDPVKHEQSIVLHVIVGLEEFTDPIKAGCAASILKNKASVGVGEGNNTLQLALKNAQKFPNTLKVIQAAVERDEIERRIAEKQTRADKSIRKLKKLNSVISRYANNLDEETNKFIQDQFAECFKEESKS